MRTYEADENVEGSVAHAARARQCEVEALRGLAQERLQLNNQMEQLKGIVEQLRKKTPYHHEA